MKVELLRPQRSSVSSVALALGIGAAAVICACLPQSARGQTTWPQRVTSVQQFALTLDSVVPRMLADYNVPSATVVLIENGKISLSKSYGYADSKQTIPVNGGSVFGLASISKLATAWGIMRLVDHGRVHLDSSAYRYLSARHRSMLSFDSRRITVRQLLSHTAGLTLRSVGTYWAPDTVPSLESELQGKTRTGEPVLRIVTDPGTKWAYSGGGYGLLQLIIEDVSRQTFPNFMTREVFRPLGMTRTFFGNPELASGTVYHVDETGMGVVKAGYANFAAAALYSTSDDFAKLVATDMLRGASTPGFLKAADYEAMETPAPGSGGIYGLGYFVESTPSGPLVGHDGSDTGWNSMYRGLSKTGDAFIMFTSGSAGIPVYASPLCGWLWWKTGVERKDYCGVMNNSVMVTLYREGEDAAVRRFDELKRARPDADFSEPYWNFLAGTMMDRRNSAASLALLRLIARLHPASAAAHENLGNGYVLTQAPGAARTAFARALEIEPNRASVLAAMRALEAKSGVPSRR